MIARALNAELIRLARSFPVVTVTGPRQSGKTTLARAAFPEHHYVTLEAPDVVAAIRADPRGFMAGLAGGTILDEVQRYPELLSYIQVSVDEDPRPGRFILTGSANFALLSGVTQSLAGRTALLTLLPLAYSELRNEDRRERTLLGALWRGGYPRLFSSEVAPEDWLRQYVGSYLERDVRQIQNVTSLSDFQNFLMLAAGHTGQILNLNTLAHDAGVSYASARGWMSVLEASYVALRIPAFHTQTRRRLVKAPKLHFLDTGLACYLLGIRSPDQLASHPLRGALFESWVAGEILKARLNSGRSPALSHFRDQRGVEVDLVVEEGRRTLGIETKSGETIQTEHFQGLGRLAELLDARQWYSPLERILVYGGTERGTRAGTEVLPWSEIGTLRWAP